MSKKLLQRIFKKVYGKPTWGVRRSDYSVISLDFGKPELRIREKVVQPNLKIGRKYPKRTVTIHGDWNLWLFDCAWTLQQGKDKLCSSKSTGEAIERGCRLLDGQILTKVAVHPKTFATDFHFDLGGHLLTRPFKEEDEPVSMWSLFCPNGRVFSLKSDGNYSYASGKTPDDKVRCEPFTFDLK